MSVVRSLGQHAHEACLGLTASACRSRSRGLLPATGRRSPYSRSEHRSARAISSDDPQVAELLRAANELIEKLGSTEERLAASDVEADATTQERRILKLVCDESSCVIVPAAESAQAHGPEGSFVGSSGQHASENQRPGDFVLSEGDGWKLGYDRNPVNTAAYTALVASDAWSVSLNKREFSDFVHLLRGLQRSIATLHTCGEWGGPQARKGEAGELSGESALELQTERIWMEARAPQEQLFDLMKVFRQGLTRRSEAQQAAFHLRFIINAPKNERQREFEGHFPPEVVMRLLEHLERYPPFGEKVLEASMNGNSGQHTASPGLST